MTQKEKKTKTKKTKNKSLKNHNKKHHREILHIFCSYSSLRILVHSGKYTQLININLVKRCMQK